MDNWGAFIRDYHAGRYANKPLSWVLKTAKFKRDHLSKSSIARGKYIEFVKELEAKIKTEVNSHATH